MNRRNGRAMVAVLLTMLACVLLLSWNAMRRAERRLADARGSYVAAVAESDRVRSLRARATRITERMPPEPDLVARLHSAMRAAGLDPRQLSSVSISRPEPIRRADGNKGDGLRRVTAPIVIDASRPSQVARLVAHISLNEPAWTITGLTLSHESRSSASRGANTANQDDLYTARLTLENVHIDTMPKPETGTSP
ncbi:MAG: hypothetical protein H6812_04475 [Phycisphaeraceae bacterium]|nr:hypothetical protein [Phycisphaerales bacterium]MCB9842493.1 hypothetical protein [Phycisphaeraceae bacterium]